MRNMIEVGRKRKKKKREMIKLRYRKGTADDRKREERR